MTFVQFVFMSPGNSIRARSEKDQTQHQSDQTESCNSSTNQYAASSILDWVHLTVLDADHTICYSYTASVSYTGE